MQFHSFSLFFCSKIFHLPAINHHIEILKFKVMLLHCRIQVSMDRNFFAWSNLKNKISFGTGLYKLRFMVSSKPSQFIFFQKIHFFKMQIRFLNEYSIHSNGKYVQHIFDCPVNPGYVSSILNIIGMLKRGFSSFSSQFETHS